MRDVDMDVLSRSISAVVDYAKYNEVPLNLQKLIDDLEDNGPGWNWIHGSNPYSNPENCGLELLAVVSEPNMSYEFNIVIVVKSKKDEKIYLAHDSGCSCPVPFEDIRGIHDMKKVNTISDFDEFFSGYGQYGGVSRMPYSEVMKARRMVAELL